MGRMEARSYTHESWTVRTKVRTPLPSIVRIHLHSASGLVQQLNNHCHSHPDSLLHNHYHVLFTRSSRKHLNQYPLENPDLQQYKRPDSIRMSSTRHFDHIVQNKALCTIELYGQNKYENRLQHKYLIISKGIQLDSARNACYVR